MKRILSLLLALVLLVTMLPFSAQAARGDKLIAITFDDGPSARYTGQLLDGLKARGVHATFFMQGWQAEASPSLVRRVYDEGHEVANHTWDHPDLTTLSSSGVVSQITRTNAVLDKACGEGTEYLVRPPYGSTNQSVRNVIGAPIILWSLDTNDWQYGYSHVYNYIVSNAYDGAIVLCHDIHKNTIPAALDAIDTLKARGYEFVTVSELFRRRGVTMYDGSRYYECEGSTDLGPVARPTITCAPDPEGVRVTIDAQGAPVYYTLGDERFTAQSTRYTGSFVLREPATIRAVAAYDLNGGRSEEVKLQISKLACAAPKIDISDGLVTLTAATPGAWVRYTTDGTAPNWDSPVYTGPFAIEPDTVIRAFSGGSMLYTSAESMLYYSPLGNVFSDVIPGKWYVGAVDEMAARGIMKGLGGYEFAPDGIVTRGMLVTLLYRYGGEVLPQGYETTHPFTDVEGERYYAEAVEWAYRGGIVNGMSKTHFAPDQAVTREQMAKIMDCFLAYRGNALPEAEDQTQSFYDGSQVSGWAKDYVSRVVAAGLIKGDEKGNLDPQGSATRAQICTVLLRMWECEETP